MERCLTSNQFTFFWHCPAASLCEWLHTKLTADFASLFILVNFFFFWLKILANFGFSPIESQNPWCPGPWIAHQTRVFLQAGRSYLYAFKRDHVWFDLFRLRIPIELKLTFWQEKWFILRDRGHIQCNQFLCPCNWRVIENIIWKQWCRDILNWDQIRFGLWYDWVLLLIQRFDYSTKTTKKWLGSQEKIKTSLGIWVPLFRSINDVHCTFVLIYGHVILTSQWKIWPSFYKNVASQVFWN